ncbi:MAG: hypothetical protein H7841_14630 [Magnetospirillum sp. WYHS-4]
MSFPVEKAKDGPQAGTTASQPDSDVGNISVLTSRIQYASGKLSWLRGAEKVLFVGSLFAAIAMAFHSVVLIYIGWVRLTTASQGAVLPIVHIVPDLAVLLGIVFGIAFPFLTFGVYRVHSFLEMKKVTEPTRQALAAIKRCGTNLAAEQRVHFERVLRSARADSDLAYFEGPLKERYDIVMSALVLVGVGNAALWAISTLFSGLGQGGFHG